MSRFATRSQEPELMDDLNCSGEVVHQTLRELEFINTWLGGNDVTIAGINTLLGNVKIDSQIKIADLGCGSGEMLRIIAKHLQKRKMNASYIGIDANPHIIEYARQHAGRNSNIHFQTANILSEGFQSQRFGIVLATLFLHHFSTEQLIPVFRSLHKQASVGIVVNDLHRHPFAFHFIRLFTQLFSKSSMVKYDAPLSVLRGFRKKELAEILKKAGISNYSLKWKWAFRWQVVIFSQ